MQFGHIGPTTVALAVKKSYAPLDDKKVFLDQILTWRNAHAMRDQCDTPSANWSTPKRTIGVWNAAQMHMVSTGWMHHYLRHVLEQKTLEWSSWPAETYGIAVYLNDKYELDGRDPNGSAGIARSMLGNLILSAPERTSTMKNTLTSRQTYIECVQR